MHSSIQRVVLPDGRAWWSPKKSDTVFVWRELYENASYESAISVLQPGDLVLDVGAHTGLAALYFAESQPDVTVHAFEPAPVLYECLKFNLGMHAPRAHAHPVAIAESARRSSFTYYPNAPSNSGLYADSAADNATSVRYLVNLGMEREDAEVSCAGLHDASGEVVEVQPLSNMIATLEVSSVALLKIDVERAELDVLRGIDSHDWPRIKAVIMEVHDIGDRLSVCSGILRREGYSIEVHQDSWLKDSELYSIFATRGSGPIHV
ncbi:MAG: FkbM family methyltransferase [Pseudonocardiaceae bacterium]